MTKKLYYIDKNGVYHESKRSSDKEISMFDLRYIAGIILAITAITTPIVTFAISQEKIRVQELSNEQQWEEMNQGKLVLAKHEALITIIQQDIQEMKSVQKENQRILYDIYKAVKQ